jgi:CheY-like chemotaxis protein
MTAAPTPVLIIDEDEAFRSRVHEVLSGVGYGVHQAGGRDEGLGRLEELQPPLVMVGLDLGDEELRLFEEIRAAHADLRIMVTTAAATPELVTRALWARVDDLLRTSVQPWSLRQRVSEVLAWAPGLPELELISVVPHWIEARFEARPQPYTRLRRFLEILEDSRRPDERTGMLFALSELTALAIEASDAALEDAWVRIACYRLGRVWGIRVRTTPGIRFAGPLQRLRQSGPRAPEPDQVTSSTWSLEAVARCADHLITSESGNEAMLLRYLTPEDDDATGDDLP